MKQKLRIILPWLVPMGFGLLGILLQTAVQGHGFLGLCCWAAAGVIVCYYLLAILKKRHLTAAKILRTVLTALLIFGVCIFIGTEAVILKASAGAENPQCPYIVVLGAKVNGTVPSLSLNDRIQAAEDYLKRHPDSIAILSGGQGPDEGVSEAQCMFNELTARGIPPERLWLEDKATSTWENIKFTLDLIEAKTGTRPTQLGVLSSEYHLFRASLFAKDCGIEALGIPASTSWPTIRLNYFLREVAGVWHYLILGGQYHD